MMPVFLLVLGAILATFGQAAFKIFVASTDISGFSLATFRAFFTTPWFFAGALAYGLSLIVYLRVLKAMDLTIAYPLFMSFSAILVFVASFAFLKEPISASRIAGVLLILLGIYALWMGK